MKKLICEGACEEHYGDVRTVFVSQWGLFNYCDVAVAEDTAKGFIVSEVYAPSYIDVDNQRAEPDEEILRQLGHGLK